MCPRNYRKKWNRGQSKQTSTNSYSQGVYMIWEAGLAWPKGTSRELAKRGRPRRLSEVAHRRSWCQPLLKTFKEWRQMSRRAKLTILRYSNKKLNDKMIQTASQLVQKEPSAKTCLWCNRRLLEEMFWELPNEMEDLAHKLLQILDWWQRRKYSMKTCTKWLSKLHGRRHRWPSKSKARICSATCATMKSTAFLATLPVQSVSRTTAKIAHSIEANLNPKWRKTPCLLQHL